MKAPHHSRQEARLAALRFYEVLDTPAEVDFDDIVQLASQICGTAISVVNLIDADRQWFKAEVGLGVRETPLDTSICAHVILQDDFVEIRDTREDPRLADNPLVQADGGLRFYAGAILRSDDGLPIGTLCVLDHEPRSLTPLQRETLRVLARQVMTQIDLRRALKQAEVLRREVDHRVKNSLQSLSALARLQARKSAPDAAAALRQMEARIETVAMLHEQLYKTDAGSVIDLAAYVANVAGYLGSMTPPGVTISTTLMPVNVSSRQAALVGTLVNEFASNSIKHAFPDGRSGQIVVSLSASADGGVVLGLSDDGIGLGDKADASDSGLGMLILSSVGQQLGSEIQLASDTGGTRLILSFAPGE